VNSVTSDEEENVSDNSSMWYGKWEKSGAEQPCFPFTGKPGLNIDLEHPSNSLEYFKVVLYARNCGSNSQRNISVCPTTFRKLD
jgi:hypothetical protein